MDHEKKTLLIREREYQQRKNQLKEKRRKDLAVKLFFSAILFVLAILIIGDTVLNQGSMPHGLSVFGVHVGGMSPEAAAQKIETAFADTGLTFTEDGETVYETTLGKLGYSLDDASLTESLDALRSEHTIHVIPWFANKSVAYQIKIDENALAAALAPDHFDTGTPRVSSSDASVEYDSSSGQFIVTNSTQGNVIDTTLLKTNLETALSEQFQEDLIQKSISFTVDESSYQQVSVSSDSFDLQVKANQLNESLADYKATSVVYTFGNTTETLDSDTICSWLIISDDGVELDSSQIWAFIDDLYNNYNTMYIPRSFVTTAGDTIEISNNEFGYLIDKDGEYEQLCKDLESGTKVEREPIYSNKGLSRDGMDDLMGTYIEVSLDQQHLWLYKDYTLVTETDIVSGQPTEATATLQGAWPIAYKASPFTLSSDYYGYEVDVTYWMPFVEGQGLHDATWQSAFGGDLYKTSAGSHGCINLPLDQAALIYQTIDSGYPIIVYSRDSSSD